jgi:hypothetical protein
MNRRILVMVLFVAACLMAANLGCVGPRQPVTTFWQKMGVPQTFLTIRDHFTNRKGNRPQCERKPPLLRIADPANLESPNAAIKAAAQVKAEEDLAPQKIKALKYLAEIGCGCYDEDGKVKDAILAGLADCTPAVRMAAIQLIEATVGRCDDADLSESKTRRCQQCGGHGCQLCQSERRAQKKKDKELEALQKKKKKRLSCQLCRGAGCSSCCETCCECNSANCCGKDVQKKLNDMAYGIDELTGCFKEPVPAIREAAARALELCPCIVEPVQPEEVQKQQGDVPEGGDTPEGEGADAPQDNNSNPNPADATDTVRILSPAEAQTMNAAFQPAVSVPSAASASIEWPTSSRRNNSDLINQTMTTGNDMVVAAIESIDLATSQMALVFSNELMIPAGEMLLVQTTAGEAQCRVVHSMPGRLYAEVQSADYATPPTAGEMIRFGVLSQ